MKQLVQFTLEDDKGTILVEVDAPEQGGTTKRVSTKSAKTVKMATQSFETALDKVKPTANAVVSKLRDLTIEPDELGVEFGLKFSAESDLILASAGVEANFKVTLTWKKNEK